MNRYKCYAIVSPMNQLVIGSKVQQMFGSIAGQYDRANTVLSFGIHHWWRRRLFRRVPLSSPGIALDLCTGTGDLLPGLANRYAQVCGMDFCAPMLLSGKKKWRKLPNVSPVQGDALSLPLADQSVDLVTVAFGVRNFEKLENGLREIRRVLKTGGKILVLEFGQPSGVIWGALYRFYSNFLMPFIGGAITGNRAAYTYLPQTSSRFPCREKFIEILERTGFERCECESLTAGIAYLYEGRAR